MSETTYTPTRRLRIAWLGPVPREDSGVPGVATDLLDGLGCLGHHIDCFFAASPRELPARLCDRQEITFTWAGTKWQWDRWYSRNRLAAFVTGLWSRGLGFRRLRTAVAKGHARKPYDVIYQFSNIETLAIPRSIAHLVPLVIHPETHAAGELRWFIAERRLGRRCHSFFQLAVVVTMLVARAAIQRLNIGRASLLICISGVFRDHLVRDYRFPHDATAVIPNPVRLERFDEPRTEIGSPPIVLVLGRIALRKGVDQVVALSHLLKEREIDVQLRIVGSRSLWSDYRPLLRDIDPTNTTYVGQVAPDAIPSELHNADILLQASKYEPFALTVAEALAAGVPVIATDEVGAVTGVAGPWHVETRVGDVEGLADAVGTMVERLRNEPEHVRRSAREHAERTFSSTQVCRLISGRLEQLVDHPSHPVQ